jgi:hypothetical protein
VVVGAVEVHVAPPGIAVTVYPVIGEPPVLTGADQLTVTWASPATPDTADGAPGTVRGVTEPDAADWGESPAALVATTWKVYGVPLVRPPTTHVVVGAVEVHVAPPGDAVTVYPVIGEPPDDTGAVHETVTWAFPGVPDTPVGAPGTVRGVTAADAADAGESPAAFVATTVNV